MPAPSHPAPQYDKLRELDADPQYAALSDNDRIKIWNEISGPPPFSYVYTIGFPRGITSHDLSHARTPETPVDEE